MNSSEVMDKLKAERKALQGLGVASLWLFGSAARDTAGPQSDLDFLVRFQQSPSFDMYMDLKLHLEQVLGVAVDLVTEDALRPELRETVARENLLVA